MRTPAKYFRAGTGAVIFDRTGRVLVCERKDIQGAWQFPQGGLEKGETALRSVLREIREETGIPSASLRLIRRYPGLLAYELPRNAQSVKTGLGQVQYWFLFGLKRQVPVDPLLSESEFRACAWVRFNTAVARVVRFKRPLYRKLQEQFEPALSGALARVSPALRNRERREAAGFR